MFNTFGKTLIAGVAAAALLFAFGMALPQDAFAARTSIANAEYMTWYGDAGTDRFLYWSGQWYHRTDPDSVWCQLSGPIPALPRIYDGLWHDLGTGLNYRYYTDGEDEWGYYARGSQYRFCVDYDAGQWYHSGYGGGWFPLSAAGQNAGLLGSGWHDLGTGLKHRYDVAKDFGFYCRGTAYRFYYQYASGQWYTSGCGGGWYRIGLPMRNANLLGSGWHDLDAWLKFRYDVTNDYGFYLSGGQYRFYYRYTPGQWYTSGYGGGWYTIGAAGRCAAVIGDGNVYDLGTGLKFRYDEIKDYGFYYLGSQYRFHYRYALGRWYHSGFGGGWYPLGGAGNSARVIADGGWHELGNQFSFKFDATVDAGYWLEPGIHIWPYVGRFRYWYGTGQWQNRGYGGTWHDLGTVGLSASFIGDQVFHDLGNGWWYQYFVGLDRGVWSTEAAIAHDRYRYTYNTGQWEHQGFTGGYFLLGNAGLSASFIADEQYHDLGNGWWYLSWLRVDGYWSTDGTMAGDRFLYEYAGGQWKHQGSTGYFFALGSAGLSASFMGDGDFHRLGDEFEYKYKSLEETGLWHLWLTILVPYDAYSYNYVTGLWKHGGAYGGLNDLGHGGMSAQWIGDGNYHSLLNGYDYKRDTIAYWRYHGIGYDTYRYNYDTGEWWWFDGLLWHHVAGPGEGTGYNNPGEP